jgi:hypothetical protein
MNLPCAILADPERPFRPCKPRVAAAARRGNGGKDAPCLEINLLNAVLGKLKQVLAIERGTAWAATLSERTVFPVAGSNAVSAPPAANQTCWPSYVTPPTFSTPGKGPYSRTTLALLVVARAICEC